MSISTASTTIAGLQIWQTHRFQDERGWFKRSFSQSVVQKLNPSFLATEVNHSFATQAGTLRGFHWQAEPKAQAKIVTCTQGTVWDVVVDLRKTSPTYLHISTNTLQAEEASTLFIPSGCAHLTLTLQPNTLIEYIMSCEYDPTLQRGFRWNDPMLDIKLPIRPSIVSEKDQTLPLLSSLL